MYQAAPQPAPDDFTSDIVLPPDRPVGQPPPELHIPEPTIRAQEKMESPVWTAERIEPSVQAKERFETPVWASERSEPSEQFVERFEPPKQTIDMGDPRIDTIENSEVSAQAFERSEPPVRRKEKSEGKSEGGEKEQKKPFQIAEFLSALKVGIEEMSLVLGKPDFCLCENRGADQLCS